jgi:hypothetical protein
MSDVLTACSKFTPSLYCPGSAGNGQPPEFVSEYGLLSLLRFLAFFEAWQVYHPMSFLGGRGTFGAPRPLIV